jgi:hypothetical protein
MNIKHKYPSVLAFLSFRSLISLICTKQALNICNNNNNNNNVIGVIKFNIEANNFDRFKSRQYSRKLYVGQNSVFHNKHIVFPKQGS